MATAEEIAQQEATAVQLAAQAQVAIDSAKKAQERDVLLTRMGDKESLSYQGTAQKKTKDAETSVQK